jgi:SPP1 gp7 family putative phage head morphogenesis protein
MTEDEYILALARALTRDEDLLAAEARPLLLELALRIRALLLTLPEGQALRAFTWRTMRLQVLVLLQQISNLIYLQIRTPLLPLATRIATPTAKFFRLPLTELPTPTLDTLLTTPTAGTTLRTLFTPSAATNASPYALQLLKLLENTVLPAFITDRPTPAIAGSILSVRNIAGQARPALRKGDVANAWLARTKAITSATLWSLVVPIQQSAATATSTTITGFRWNAILDPKTCPLCIALNGTVVKEIENFQPTPPPRHPLCRCVAIPLFN